MKNFKSYLNFITITLLLVFLFQNTTFAQKNKDKKVKTEEDAKKATFEQYKNQAIGLIKYLEGTLNAIGSEYTPTYEKQIMINESYNKIFLDENVQVEDDLDENREIYAYKDVQAYLQDVDFFFKKVEFKFEIDTVEQFYNSDEQAVFKVKTIRNLIGTTIANEEINSFSDRYIEINLNEEEQSLKVVSFYTTKLNESDELKTWWKELSSEWRSVFKKKLNLKDSVSYDQLKVVLKTSEIDISNNKKIKNLKPLTKLTRLKKLNCSNTNISDLYPIRNLNKLEVLNCRETKVSTIKHLQYATKLQDLYLDDTKISDLSVVENFQELKKLSFRNTNVSNIDAFIELTFLEDLRFCNTKVSKIDALNELTNIKIIKFDNSPIQSLKNLKLNKQIEYISFSGTKITDLSPLKEMNKLKFIYFDSTKVNSLKELENLKKLETIYCDNSGIDSKKATDFIINHPNTLVIFNSDELNNWWKEMPDYWKAYFVADYKKNKPDKEQLHKLSHIKEINIAGKTNFTDIKALEKLKKLNKLDISKTPISDINALKGLIDLQNLNCSNTKIVKLSPLASCTNLETLNCENTEISDVIVLKDLSRLKVIYADNSELNEKSFEYILNKNNKTLVVFRTEKLKKWWNLLDKKWKEIFKKEKGITGKPTKEQLEAISEIKNLDLKDYKDITGLKPLEMLINLRILKFSDTDIMSLVSLKRLYKLKELHCARNPIQNLDAIKHLKNIEYFDCSNTRVESLEAISNYKNIKTLKISGTKIKNLNDIETLKSLKHLEFSSTSIKWLKPIKELNKLNTIKCYNTKIMKVFMNKYKEENPKVNVIY